MQPMPGERAGTSNAAGELGIDLFALQDTKLIPPENTDCLDYLIPGKSLLDICFIIMNIPRSTLPKLDMTLTVTNLSFP